MAPVVQCCVLVLALLAPLSGCVGRSSLATVGRTCSENAECPEACIDGICTEYASAGQRCEERDDCDTDLDCVEEFCVVTDCGGLPDLTRCSVDTSAMDGGDRAYDICVNGACVSPGCGDASCNAPGPGFPLADTNQRDCFSDSAVLTCGPMSACDSTSYCGQDAQIGWDAANPAAARFARSEPVAGEPVVLDNVTGLLWQGCAAGQIDGCRAEGPATWREALAYCDELDWGDHADWRLPSTWELHSIADLGRFTLAIDPTAFPGGPQTWDTWFWSSSTSTNAANAWMLRFYEGYVHVGDKNELYNVRCVREDVRAIVLPVTRFVAVEPVAGEPVVEDHTTGLLWQGGYSGGITWADALAYCENLEWGGHADWHLPDAKELRTIIDERIDTRSISPVFPQTYVTHFWSSTTAVSDLATAWQVNFYGGVVGWVAKSDSGEHARCVRRLP